MSISAARDKSSNKNLFWWTAGNFLEFTVVSSKQVKTEPMQLSPGSEQVMI